MKLPKNLPDVVAALECRLDGSIGHRRIYGVRFTWLHTFTDAIIQHGTSSPRDLVCRARANARRTTTDRIRKVFDVPDASECLAMERLSEAPNQNSFPTSGMV